MHNAHQTHAFPAGDPWGRVVIPTPHANIVISVCALCVGRIEFGGNFILQNTFVQTFNNAQAYAAMADEDPSVHVEKDLG